ncbi:MAG: hypothetical protein MZW92_44050 [Comamonadaceae bacterium]|nr:hypothetical protein [Comamonadaceae bacterium]
MELNRWLSTPTPDNVMTGSMFMDLRALYGRNDLSVKARDHAFATLSKDQGFLDAHGAEHDQLPAAAGLVRQAQAGKLLQRGKFDVKKAGIFAITDGVKALAIEAHALSAGLTHDRIEAADGGGDQARGRQEPGRKLRLPRHDAPAQPRRALRALALNLTDYVSMDMLNVMQQGELRLALEQVGEVQGFIKHHFRLQLLRN